MEFRRLHRGPKAAMGGGSGGAKRPQLECGGFGGASPSMRGKGSVVDASLHYVLLVARMLVTLDTSPNEVSHGVGKVGMSPHIACISSCLVYLDLLSRAAILYKFGINRKSIMGFLFHLKPETLNPYTPLHTHHTPFVVVGAPFGENTFSKSPPPEIGILFGNWSFLTELKQIIKSIQTSCVT